MRLQKMNAPRFSIGEEVYELTAQGEWTESAITEVLDGKDKYNHYLIGRDGQQYFGYGYHTTNKLRPYYIEENNLRKRYKKADPYFTEELLGMLERTPNTVKIPKSVLKF